MLAFILNCISTIKKIFNKKKHSKTSIKINKNKNGNNSIQINGDGDIKNNDFKQK